MWASCVRRKLIWPQSIFWWGPWLTMVVVKDCEDVFSQIVPAVLCTNCLQTICLALTGPGEAQQGRPERLKQHQYGLMRPEKIIWLVWTWGEKILWSCCTTVLGGIPARANIATKLNYKHWHQTPWWNKIYLSLVQMADCCVGCRIPTIFNVPSSLLLWYYQSHGDLEVAWFVVSKPVNVYNRSRNKNLSCQGLLLVWQSNCDLRSCEEMWGSWRCEMSDPGPAEISWDTVNFNLSLWSK